MTSPAASSRWLWTGSPLIFSLTLCSGAMKYLLSRLLMRAADFGAKNPLSLIDAMDDLPIMVILLVSAYFSWSLLPSITLSMPTRSLTGVAAAAMTAGVNKDLPAF